METTQANGQSEKYKHTKEKMMMHAIVGSANKRCKTFLDKEKSGDTRSMF